MLAALCLRSQEHERAAGFHMNALLLQLISFGFTICNADAFLVPEYARVSPQRRATSSSCTCLHARNDDEQGEPDGLTKASWYAVEAFGKLFGQKDQASKLDGGSPPSSIKETKARLQQDNEREYFLSGEIDTLIYDDQCVFADPFVSFAGRDRFVENLENLGSFITNYNAKPLSYTEGEDFVETKFMVKLELNLPWKPILAWPWGVRCEIDPDTNLITVHKESWDIDAIEGVKQIFRKPTVRI